MQKYSHSSYYYSNLFLNKLLLKKLIKIISFTILSFFGGSKEVGSSVDISVSIFGVRDNFVLVSVDILRDVSVLTVDVSFF